MHIDVDNENNEIQQQERPENPQNKPKKVRYKIEWKKFGLLLGGLIRLCHQKILHHPTGPWRMAI